MLKITDKMILTAGPSITLKEIEYVNDAVQHGWNNHHSDYLKKFEQAFADYVGVKYAMATSSCTGALHLALLAMGIGPGDEVIVPETSWIATVSAVIYVGATPIFADIEPDTWVMDPKSVEKLITPKTKVIIPVHLYGHPVNMEPLWELSNKYGIDILEDAAPSIGAEYKGKKTGSLGRAAAFSFQGAKALVTGEGGIFVTDDKDLMERVRFLGDHGRDPNRALYNIEIGYKYKMSNLTAALGLAQIERAEEIVAKKRQIFNWYQERLSDIDSIKLNTERPWARSIYWMSSLVLGDGIDFSRDEFMSRLKQRNIDTRPFFYPMSSFPMFEGVQVDNPIAYKIPLRAVNLPSGHERTEEEIDYICAHIRDILGQGQTKVSASQPTGWLAYRDYVNNTLAEAKQANEGVRGKYTLPILENGQTLGSLVPLTVEDVQEDTVIQKLADWREIAQKWYPSQFTVTFEGTRKWAEKQLIQTEDRILFMVEDVNHRQIGHVGLFRIDYHNKYVELDNIVRGDYVAFPGAMTHACKTLINWAYNELDMERLYLRVVSDNQKALELYDRLGFKEIQRMPQTKVEENGSTRWVELIGYPYKEVERYYVTMELSKSEWVNG